MMRATLIALMLGQAGGYLESCRHAQSTGKPLVIGIGCMPPAGDWLVATVVKLDGYAAPCIVVALPGHDWPEWAATFKPGATAAEIRAACRKPSLQPKYNPDTQPNFQQRMDKRRRVFGRGYPWQQADAGGGGGLC